MKTILILGTLGGLFLGLIPEINYFFFPPPREIKMPNLDFVRVNGTVENNGEKFEVFWPPL